MDMRGVEDRILKMAFQDDHPLFDQSNTDQGTDMKGFYRCN